MVSVASVETVSTLASLWAGLDDILASPLAGFDDIACPALVSSKCSLLLTFLSLEFC